jgi:parvulin-like peptidyl-prolyl isomerase
MHMRRTLPSLLLVLALAAPATLRAEVLNRIVLRVNDQIATLYDYQQRRQDLTREVMRREMDPQERQEVINNLPQVVFRDMLQELLLQSRAQQLAVTVSDAQIDGAVEQMKQSFGIKTAEEFQAALAQSGMTEAQLRQQLRDNLQVREVMEREVRTRIKLNEEDLRRYYRKNTEQFRTPEQVQLREVVVLDQSGLATAEERARTAAEIREAAAGGKSLADVTITYRDMGVTSNVIDLGWVSPGDLDPALEAAAWKLKPGEVSEPVAGRGGLHLLQAVDRRESRIPPFSEVSAQIEAREQNRVYNEEVVKYLAELEKKSLVVADPPQEAADFRKLLERPEPTEEDNAIRELVRPNRGAAPAPATPEQAAPGALPQPKPVDTTPPPVTEPPPATPPPGPGA